MLKLSILALAAVALFGQVARADEPPVVLRLADGMPSGHVIDRLIVEPYIKLVAERTKGRVAIQHYPAEQLGKSRDMLILTQTGVADIGFVVPSYMSDRMPLTAVMELPGIFQTTCQGNAALRALTAEGAILDQAEFRPNHIRPLITFLMPAYQMILSSSHRLDSMADVKGLKIRTPGGGMDLTVLGLGAVPIRVSPPEMYESMSRGTLDGALLAYQSAVSYHLPALLKSGTIGQDLGTVAITFSIGDKAWDRLPVDIRQVLADAGRELSETACDRFDEAERTAIDTVRKAGVRLVTLAEDPTEAEAFAQVRNDWASRLDARGKPGSAVLAAFLREAAAAPR